MLYLLIGPSGSGKSTYAAENFSADAVLSSDAVRHMYTGDHQDMACNQDVFNVLEDMVMHRMKRGRFTVVDATNLTREHRYRSLYWARRYQREAYGIVFDTTLEECLNRQGQRMGDRVTPLEAMEKHFQRFQDEPPVLEEGFAEIHYVG